MLFKNCRLYNSYTLFIVIFLCTIRSTFDQNITFDTVRLQCRVYKYETVKNLFLFK